MRLRPLLWNAIAVTLAVKDVAAFCECGYSASVYGQDSPALFTDLIETDFTAIDLVLSDNTDWRTQQYSQSAAARGRYGQSFVTSGAQLHAGTGIFLQVENQPQNDMIPCAELATSREDLFYGTYRVGMTLSSEPGTCAAFFWYFNDTQEIDMEFLSRQFDFENQTFPINLVLQSSASSLAGYDASKTPYFKTLNLPFNPTVGIHEYRLDYLANSIVFYADGFALAQMTGPGVPNSAGELLISHWSNGNAKWSGGPPSQNSSLTVAYVKAYFNSSSPDRLHAWEDRCYNPSAEDAICSIPGTITVAAPTEPIPPAAVPPPSPSRSPSTNSPDGYFFYTHTNMTSNQTIYQQTLNRSTDSVSGALSDRKPLVVLQAFVMGTVLLVGASVILY